MSKFVRHVNIHIENKEIGDRPIVMSIAESLKEYAKLIEDHKIGFDQCESFKTKNGSQITIIAGNCYPCNID